MSASEMDAEQVAQFVAMREEMDDMRLRMAQMEAIKKCQAEQKLFARKAAIKAECDKYTNKVRVYPGVRLSSTGSEAEREGSDGGHGLSHRFGGGVDRLG